MAKTYKLVMVFADADGKTITHSYNYAKSSPNSMAVSNVMSKIIESGEIFKAVPVTKKSAYVIATEQTNITLSTE